MSRRRKPLPTFAGIRCPQCKHEGSSVVDSRDCPGKDARRRRHECDKCKLRFTTMEILNAEYERLAIPGLDRQMVKSAIASLRAIEKSLR